MCVCAYALLVGALSVCSSQHCFMGKCSLARYSVNDVCVLSDMGFFRRSADFRRLRGPTGHF